MTCMYMFMCMCLYIFHKYTCFTDFSFFQCSGCGSADGQLSRRAELHCLWQVYIQLWYINTCSLLTYLLWKTQLVRIHLGTIFPYTIIKQAFCSSWIVKLSFRFTLNQTHFWRLCNFTCYICKVFIFSSKLSLLLKWEKLKYINTAKVFRWNKKYNKYTNFH